MKTSANFDFSYCTDCAAACTSVPVCRIMDTALQAVSILVARRICVLRT